MKVKSKMYLAIALIVVCGVLMLFLFGKVVSSVGRVAGESAVGTNELYEYIKTVRKAQVLDSSDIIYSDYAEVTLDEITEVLCDAKIALYVSKSKLGSGWNVALDETYQDVRDLCKKLKKIEEE